MKVAKKEQSKKKNKSIKIKSTLTDKYADQPLFQDKIEKANHILKTIGLPKA